MLIHNFTIKKHTKKIFKPSIHSWVYINYCYELEPGLFTRDARKRDGRVDEDPGPSQHLQLPRMLRCVSPWNFASAVHHDARPLLGGPAAPVAFWWGLMLIFVRIMIWEESDIGIWYCLHNIHVWKLQPRGRATRFCYILTISLVYGWILPVGRL